MFAREQKQVRTGAVHTVRDEHRMCPVLESCPATAVLVKPTLCPAAHASADCCANRGHLTPTMCWGPGSPHGTYSFPLSSRFLPLRLFNGNSNRSFPELSVFSCVFLHKADIT